MKVGEKDNISAQMKKYDWTRYWCEEGGSYQTDHLGYLYDPDSAMGKYANKGLIPTESLKDIPCIILIGEPGIGKSTEIEKLHQISKDDRYETTYFNLRDFDSNTHLDKNIFEGDALTNWRYSDNTLCLFLDSLDEALISIAPLALHLATKIGELPTKRLKLRIACRTAEWQNLQVLKDSLSRLYDRGKEENGTNRFRVMELLPLRQKDVLLAGQAKGLDGNAFVQEIESKEAVPLAIKPVTLEFLISTYSKNCSLPSSKKDLYLEGCRLLCEEVSPSRKASKRKGKLSTEQRFRIACLIAALSILTKKSGIVFGITNRNSTTDLLLDDLYEQKIDVNSDTITLDEKTLQETLDSGLFSSLGSERLWWSHQTYAEFLAAYFVVSNEFSIKQISGIVFHQGDSDGKVVPQLNETVAWIAGMLPDIFREVLKREPELLLLSDVSEIDDTDRMHLVESLLGAFQDGKLLRLDYDIKRRYSKLDHPKIADQLRTYINDISLDYSVRCTAIHIATFAKVAAVSPEILDIVLDENQSMDMRLVAASALTEVEDTSIKEKLKQLAFNSNADEENDELKGYCLMAAWPKCITAEELFQILPPFSGGRVRSMSYRQFLSEHLVQRLSPNDLPLALKWLCELPLSANVGISLGQVFKEILFKSWENIDLPNVLPAFAKTLVHVARKADYFSYDKLTAKLSADIVKNNKGRHLLLKAISNYIQGENDTWYLSRTEGLQLLTNDDFNWFSQQLACAPTDQGKMAFSYFLINTFYADRRSNLWILLKFRRFSQILKNSYSVTALLLGIIHVRAFRLYYKIKSKSFFRRRRRFKKKKTKYRVHKYVSQQLKEFEKGNVDAWWRLNVVITVEESDGQFIRNEYDSDLTNFDGWINAPQRTKHRIIIAARSYLELKNPKTLVSLKKDASRPSMAGYRALRLLSKVEPSSIENLPDEIWERWAASIVSFPDMSEKNREIQKEFVKKAYGKAPQQIIDSLFLLIDLEDKKGHIEVLEKIDHALDEQLCSALLEKVKDPNLKQRTIELLFKTLFNKDFVQAFKYAKTTINEGISNPSKHDRAITAACSLVLYTKDASWSAIWPIMLQDAELAKSIIEALMDSTGRFNNDLPARISEHEIGQLYTWMVKQYPPDDDPRHEGELSYTPGTRELIADFRNLLITHLSNRGTVEACAEIALIIEEFPNETWYKDTLRRARENMRRQTWIAPKTTEFLALLSNKEKRFIESEKELQEVVLECLGKYQEELKGELSPVSALWNEDYHHRHFWPKEENDFSDHVARFLRREISSKGVVVNREVRIRRPHITDVHIEAYSEKDKRVGILKVIVEVKGCWNKELWEAMESQLLNKYLKNNTCDHGVYLVGWFQSDSSKKCKRWNNKKLSISEVTNLLTKQAQHLSNDKEIRAVVLDTSRG